MNLTALLLITLSGNGHWLGGHTETIEVQWAVKQPIPGATLAWRLVCGDAELASGRLALPAEQRPGIIRLALPQVRVQTAMQLIYRAEQAGKSTPLARGAAAVEVYPDDLLAGLSQRMAGKQLLVWDAADGLPARAEARERQAHRDRRRRRVAVCPPRRGPGRRRASGQGDARAGEVAESGPRAPA